MSEEELREYCSVAGKKICDQEYEIRTLKQQKKKIMMCEYFMAISILKNEDKNYEKKIEYYESLLKNGVRMSDFIIYQNEIKSLICKRIFLKLLEFVIIKKMLEEKRR